MSNRLPSWSPRPPVPMPIAAVAHAAALFAGAAAAQAPAAAPPSAPPSAPPTAPPSAPPASTRPLHLIIPFAPGGAQDVIGRYLGERLAARSGITVVVENKAGAGGLIAAETVGRAAPDGNTLLLATGGAISIAPHLKKLPYDPIKDFAPVALIGDTPMTLAVRAQSPYQTVADVLSDAKARPGEVTFASTGSGTVSHLTGELLAQAAGIKLVHVPYRGASPALTDLLGGQVALMVTSVASIDPMVNDGKARVLATFTPQRIPGMKAPTMTEASRLDGMSVPVWVGLLAPAATPAAVVARLAADFEAICRMPQTLKRFEDLGATATCGDPAALGTVVREDLERWGRVIRQGGIKGE